MLLSALYLSRAVAIVTATATDKVARTAIATAAETNKTMALLAWGEGVGYETTTFDGVSGRKLGGAVFPQWRGSNSAQSCGAWNPIMGAWHFISDDAQLAGDIMS
jgi:hypothetical protein